MDIDSTTHGFPADFLASLAALESAYLEESDPIRQSGFAGGPDRWRSEREPLLAAVNRDGAFLDVGCANGFLLESIREWSRERGLSLDLHGLEYSAALADLARDRLGAGATIHTGNAWDWIPPRRYTFVYSVSDVVPRSHLSVYIRRLASDFASAGGRVILGAYGSRSRNQEPYDVVAALESASLAVAGSKSGGDPPISLFAWTDASAAI